MEHMHVHDLPVQIPSCSTTHVISSRCWKLRTAAPPGQNLPYLLGYWAKKYLQDRSEQLEERRRLLCNVWWKELSWAQEWGSCLLGTYIFQEAETQGGSYLSGKNPPYCLGYRAENWLQDSFGQLIKHRRLLRDVIDDKGWAETPNRGSCLLSTCIFKERQKSKGSYLPGQKLIVCATTAMPCIPR